MEPDDIRLPETVDMRHEIRLKQLVKKLEQREPPNARRGTPYHGKASVVVMASWTRRAALTRRRGRNGRAPAMT
jgi:hypothetical protein